MEAEKKEVTINRQIDRIKDCLNKIPSKRRKLLSTDARKAHYDEMQKKKEHSHKVRVWRNGREHNWFEEVENYYDPQYPLNTYNGGLLGAYHIIDKWNRTMTRQDSIEYDACFKRPLSYVDGSNPEWAKDWKDEDGKPITFDEWLLDDVYPDTVIVRFDEAFDIIEKNLLEVEAEKVQQTVDFDDGKANVKAGGIEKPQDKDRQNISGGNISGMSWQDAQKKAEGIIDECGFRGFMKLKEAVGCSKKTLRKAINNSDKLKKAESQRKDMPSTLKAVGVTEKVLATYIEKSEGPQLTDIEVEEIMAEIIQQVKEQRPAELEEAKLSIGKMSPTEKHNFVKAFQNEYKALKKHNRTHKDEKITFFSEPENPHQYKNV